MTADFLKNVHGVRGASRHELQRAWIELGKTKKLNNYLLALRRLTLAMQNLVSAPLQTFLTVSAIASALTMLCASLVVLENVRMAARSAEQELTLTLFLKPSFSENSVNSLQKEIVGKDQVSSAVYVAKGTALEGLRDRLGDSAIALEGLDVDNPLPDSIEVRFKPGINLEDTVQKFSEAYGKHSEVEAAYYNRGVLGNLASMRARLKLGAFALVSFMLSLSGFVTANAISLNLYARRAEIEIMQLVGASRTFIAAPFIFEGLIFGFLGAVLSVMVVWSAVTGFNLLLHSDLIASAALPKIEMFRGWSILIAIAAGSLVGACGAFAGFRQFSLRN